MITVSQIRGAAGADYYCTGGAEGPDAASYYVQATEPPGSWSGAGAHVLGLGGVVTDEAMRAVFGEYETPDGGRIGRAARGSVAGREQLAAALAREPGANPERREEISLAVELDSTTTGFDFTFSAVKSVSVLHQAACHAEVAAQRAGDGVGLARAREVRAGIEDAIQAGARAGMEYLAARAMTRVGRHGKGTPGRWMGAPGLVIASFFQHTNRNGDPHLHVHNAMLNRVQSADGVWRALDGRDLMRHQHAAGRVAQAVMRDRLAGHGVVWQQREGGTWEAAVAPSEICELWSSRDVEIDERVRELIEAVQERNGGRRLTPAELARVKELATLGTRQAKSVDAETWAERVDRAVAEVHTIGLDLGAVYTGLERGWDTGATGAVQVWSPRTVISEAIAACGEASATFRAPDLTAEILRRLPPVLGLDAAATIDLAERLTAGARCHPDLVQVSGRREEDPGADPFGRPTDDQFAAVFTLEAEQAIRRLAVQRGAHHLPAEGVAAWLDAHAQAIGADQRAAVEGIAASDAVLSVLVGPAGTGKSYAMGALAGAWQDLAGGGRVIGLATSEAATNVLRDDGLDHCLNVAAFLAAQSRLAAGSTHPGDLGWVLGPRDVVMVDEASMVATADLSAIRERVQAAGARLVLTGDPHQLSAVQAGGVMGLVADHAETFTLAEVRRFAEPWERDASLRLRAGDTGALDVYDKRARFQGYQDVDEAVEAVARAWVADRLDGRDVLAVAVSNDLAAQVSRVVRDMLITYGEVTDGPAVALGRDDNLASVGDLVQARRIDHMLGLTNREVYRVVAVTDDAGLDVVSVRTGEHLHMPPTYARADAALAYASTVHAAQGRTVDACHYLADRTPDAEGLYVAMSRGRVRNTAHVPLTTTPHDVAPGVSATVTRASALEVLAPALDREPEGRAALVEAEADAQRRACTAEILARIEHVTRTACRQRTERHLDDLVAAGVLAEADRARLCADQATEHLSRLLRAVEHAGRDPREVLRDAVSVRDLVDADSVAQVLAARITGGHPLPAPSVPLSTLPADLPADDVELLGALHKRAADRRRDLGRRAAAAPPTWALEHLGPVPATGDARRVEWVDRAGTIAALREATGHADEHRVLPPPPTGPHSTERRALHLAAHKAAGYPEVERPTALWTDGQVLIRLRAERDALAVQPRYAAPDLKAAEQAREAARQAAALREREADLAAAARHTHAAAALRAEAAAHRAEEADRAQAVEHHAREVDRHTEWAQAYGPTLAQGAQAQAEANARSLRINHEDDRTTAAQWLAAERRARQADDTHRPITETDLTEATHPTTGLDDDTTSLDTLPEIDHAEPVPLGSNARRAALEAQCAAAARRSADIRSQNATEPANPDTLRHRRWVLDEATAAANTDADYAVDAH